MTNSVYPGVSSDAYEIATPSSEQAVQFSPAIASGFRVGSAGDVAVRTYDGREMTISSVQAGERIDLLFSAVLGATTADQITIFR